jgi:hypothetical protein
VQSSKEATTAASSANIGVTASGTALFNGNREDNIKYHNYPLYAQSHEQAGHFLARQWLNCSGGSN